MESNKYSESVRRITRCLKELTYIKNVPFCVIWLFFVKYITQNHLCAYTLEDMMEYGKADNIFSPYNIGSGYTNGEWDAFNYVLSNIDEYYNLNGLLKRITYGYAKDILWQNENWIRKNKTFNSYSSLMYELSSLDLSGRDDECETFIVGKEIVSNLLYVVFNVSKSYIKDVGDYTTQNQLADLAGKILNVKDGETFCDFASGIGASTIKIVGTAKAKIYNVEIDEEIAAIAVMLYIMSGYKNVNLEVADGFSGNFYDFKADKIFVDPPREDVYLNYYGNGNIAIDIAINYLNDGGMAVVTAPNATLFRNSYSEREQRKRLFEGGYINCIISLPPCWLGTGIATNLVVLSKTQNKDILFIDASNNKIIKFYEKDRGKYLLTDNGIQEIVKIFETRTEIAGVSKVVNNLVDNYTLQPSAYIEAVPFNTAKDTCTVEEIDAELEELYARFVKLIDDD